MKISSFNTTICAKYLHKCTSKD